MRLAATLLLGAFLAAWADAQQTAAVLTAGERRQQLQANRKLLEKMVHGSVALANANAPLDRAAACHAAIREISLALDGAIKEQDPSRVAELGDYLVSIVDDGLLPNLEIMKEKSAVGSPDRDRLIDLHRTATGDLKKLELSVPATDALGRSPQVKQTLANWQAAHTRLAGMME